MNQIITILITLALPAVGSARLAVAQPVAESGIESVQTPDRDRFLLGPPKSEGPVVVLAGFQLHDIIAINDEEEAFEFTGTLTLQWRDPRQAFDPDVTGVNEKVYQGDFQFNEVFTGWYPQVVLVNAADPYDGSGVVLRVKPDGTLTLVQSLNAVAKARLNMRRFPFDRHRLEAVFEVLGFDPNEVVLEVQSAVPSSLDDTVRITQWTVTGLSASTHDRPAPYAGTRGVASAFVVTVDVRRASFFIERLVVVPLILIVLLSFSVFWMDRSSLGDRINVSFIGILTAVAYQIVMSDILPHISYFTLMNGFLNISFFTMCATVVINLAVGACDQSGRLEVGDRIDRRCRWIFPLTYFGLILLAIGTTFLFF